MLSRLASPRSAAWLALLAVAVAGAGACAPGADESEGEGEGEEHDGESPEPPATSDEGLSGGTVQQATQNGCSTIAVRGLSLQIIEEGNCITPDAYAHIPERPNFRPSDVVFPYLEGPAKNKLVEALDANPGKTMTVNSMLRTVAQQYMLYRWYQTGRCDIGLAAKPGNSNHETGLAIDISEYSSWKSALSSRGFNWFGNGDKPHFDYRGSGAVDHRGLDVKAFQRLWNRNNPNDTIDEDGDYGPQTESRLKQAPASGFPVGAICNDPQEGGDGDGDGDAPEDLPQSSGPDGDDGAGDDGGNDDGGDGGSCPDACAEGAARPASCDACAAEVCAVDDYCCITEWDVACVQLAGDMASCGCGASGDDGSGDDGSGDDGSGDDGSGDDGGDDAFCAHDEFALGDALIASCSECAGAVCDLDDYCCTVEWDSTCVDQAMDMCE